MHFFLHNEASQSVSSVMAYRLERHFGFRFDDRPADDFDNLRDDGVSESPKSVHPAGNPMSHSTHVGFNAPPATAFNGRLFR